MSYLVYYDNGSCSMGDHEVGLFEFPDRESAEQWVAGFFMLQSKLYAHTPTIVMIEGRIIKEDIK